MSARRLLFFAVVLPGIVAVVNEAAIQDLPHSPWRIAVYPLMAASIAILSVCTGRFLRPGWLAWIVFGWSLVLLNALVVAVSLAAPYRHFGYLMVTAQISLVVVWAILGPSNWQWRLPVVLVAAPIILAFAGFLMNAASNWRRGSNWTILMAMTTAVVTLLCGSVRMAGFRLNNVNAENGSQTQPDRVLQFGMRHMLVWSAALVPLLLVARGIDFLVLKRIGTAGTFPVVLLAFSLALLSLSAIWAVLGSGRPVLRALTLFLLPSAFAYGMHRTTLYVEKIRAFGWYAQLDVLLREIRDTWTTWMYMNALLLAALLLFLRAKGYRLERRQSS
jgi:hypothetical protein